MDDEYRLLASRLEKLLCIEPLQIHYDSGWKRLLDTPFTDLLTVILILIVLSPLFTQEYESGVDLIILSSRNGRRDLVSAKVAAALVTVLTTFIVLNSIDIIVLTRLFQFPGSQMPIQSLELFGQSISHFTVYQYIFVFFTAKFFGCIAFSLLVLAVSALSKSSMASVFISSCIYGLPMMLGRFPTSYYGLINVNKLINTTDEINTFGVYIMNFYITITLLILATICSVFVIYHTFCRRR